MMLLPFLSSIVHAGDVQQDEWQSGEVPGVELLEFLGEWETEEGEWIDPEEMEDDYLARQLAGTVPADKNE